MLPKDWLQIPTTIVRYLFGNIYDFNGAVMKSKCILILIKGQAQNAANIVFGIFVYHLGLIDCRAIPIIFIFVMVTYSKDIPDCHQKIFFIQRL